MSTLLTTLLIAFLLIIIALGLLAVGWLVTGKSRIRAGSCGRNPHQKRSDEEGCGTSSTCSLCETTKKDDKHDDIQQK